MKKPARKTFPGLIIGLALLALAAPTQAWEPNNNDLDAAVNIGDFGGYFTNVTAWLNQKMPAGAPAEADLKALVLQPVFRNTLDQRQFILKHGVAELDAFAKADPKNKPLLAWFLGNTKAMDLYMEAATPGGEKNREANTYRFNVESLEFLRKIIDSDPEAKEGLYLRLAMAVTFSAPSQGTSYGSGLLIDHMGRYHYYKKAHKDKELVTSFDYLSVWDLESVVNSWAADRELTWVREMIRTFRPDLNSDTKVIEIVSDVWRRFSPFPFTNGFITVMAGGGKCGPRSWFGEMACKAFGLPSQARGQPQHSAVTYKSPDPLCEPQPGSSWKVCHGRGWHVTDGGYGLLVEAAARDRVELFSEIEHLTWLATSLTAKGQTDAILDVVHKLQQTIPKPSAGPNPALGPNGEAIPLAAPTGWKAPPPHIVAEPPFPVVSGVIHVEAETFTNALADAAYPNEQKSCVFVNDCFTGGKQVNFQRNMKFSCLDYVIDVSAAGEYGLTMRIAAPNYNNVFDISSGETKLATVNIPYTMGLWGTTPEVTFKLNKGVQTLRISAPLQRGVALRWFELKAK